MFDCSIVPSAQGGLSNRAMKQWVLLIDKIKSDLVAAMRANDEVGKLVLRSLLSAMNYYKIELQKELSDEDAARVISKEVKKHKESIEMFKKAGRLELVEKEQKEMNVLSAYLPKQISREEVEKIIKAKSEELKAKNELNMGNLMKTVMGELREKADGKIVKEIVDQIFKTT